MKLEDNDNFEESNSNVAAVAVGVSLLAIAVVICAVLYMNYDTVKKKLYPESVVSETQISVSSIKQTVSSSDLHVSDLDFYDMYKDRETSDSEDTETTVAIEEPQEPVEEINETNDGKHTLVTDYNGESEWVTISPYLTKHNYDFLNLVNQSGQYKYFSDDRCISSFGVDISKDQGYVDFNKLKKAGADFVMIRVGQRGYQTGSLSEDEYFKDSLKRATDAGMAVGVYFLSQAITVAEAEEEADYVLERIKDYKLSYPVAFVMKYAENDSARVETVSRNDKSMIARAFLKKISDAGYNTILYGDKTWLIRYVDMSKIINDYDVWLSQTDVDMPDYPYKFSMWQYSTSGSIDGISGSVNFNISFLDYSLK